MHSNLMSASGARNRANDAELVAGCSRPSKPSFDRKFGLRRRAGNVNHLFEPDRGVLVVALPIQWSVDKFVFPFGPAPNDREIFFMQ